MHAARLNSARAIALTLLLTLLLALSFQGTRGLWGPDEGRYSNIALQMLETGDWVTPRRHPEHTHFAKPPLTYWAIASSVQLFGYHESSLRLPNALGLIGTVLLLILLGRRLVPSAPWLPGLLFATSFVPFAAGNLINTDYLLTLFETLAVYGFVRLWQADSAREAGTGRLWLWIGFGLAFLTKGPPGLLPLLPMLVWRWMQPAPRLQLVDLRALALFLLIAMPWYVLVVIKHEGLLGYFLGYEVVGRVFTDVHDRNSSWMGLLETYLPVLLLGLLPWSVFLLGRTGGLWRQRGQLRQWWQARAAEDRWLLIWFALPVLIFLCVRSRLPLYLLPSLVPATLLIARRLTPLTPARARRVAWIAAISAVILLALKGYAPGAMPHSKDARELAQLVGTHWDHQPSEIVFIEESANYGLRFYLGVPVERVSLSPRSDPAYDSTLASELNEDESRVWITTENRVQRVETAVAPLGYRYQVYAKLDRFVLGRMQALP
ncbi:MAG: ArnT family glycosyltransferase [Lysobacterales bacterium]